MKRRIFAMILAGAMVLALAACGGDDGGSSSGGIGVSSSANTGSSQDGSSSSDGSNPDGSQPDASNPDGSQAGGDTSAMQPIPSVSITLNRTDITLNKAGATFKLRFTAEPDTDGIPTFTSDDPKIATVAEDGTIKAVAPGKTTIVVRYDGAAAACTVTCTWKEESKPDSSSQPAEPAPPDTATQVDLQKFYTDMETKYEFTAMMLADKDFLSQKHSDLAEIAPKAFYAGLENVNLKQQVIYLCGMMPAPTGDFALVEVADAKDVDTVKAIFQAQIDYMVGDGNSPGGAFYPMEQTMWEENARIAVNGNYVMLIASDNCDAIVSAFNALF